MVQSMFSVVRVQALQPFQPMLEQVFVLLVHSPGTQVDWQLFVAWWYWVPVGQE